jgi:hypothetical protein
VSSMPDRATIRGRRDLALLEVLAHAGLRRGEAAALRPARRWALAARRSVIVHWLAEHQRDGRRRSAIVGVAIQSTRTSRWTPRSLADLSKLDQASVTVGIAPLHADDAVEDLIVQAVLPRLPAGRLDEL